MICTESGRQSCLNLRKGGLTLKFIKFILCLSIILFAFPAVSEIYKYVDENGNIHFTDDFNKVPVEQRSAVDVSVEYENGHRC